MTRRGPVLAAVGGIALIVLMVALVIMPKASQVREKRDEVEAARQQEAQLQVRLEQLRALAQEAPKNRRRLARLDAALPPRADLPGLIRLLNGIADKSGVDWMSIAPSTPTASQFTVAVVPAQITVAGRFFSVDQYLYRLENLPRAAKVTSIQVSPGGGGLQYLQVALSVEFYTTDPSAGPAASGSGQSSAAGGTTSPAPQTTPAPTTTVPPAGGGSPATGPSSPGA